MGDKSPKPSEEFSQSTQDVWSPQGNQLESLYGSAADWTKSNQGTISGLAEQQQGNAQGALDTAMPAWQNQLQGGNLQGYDIAGGLNSMIGQGNQVGPVQQSHAWDQYNQNVGPGGSLANMEGMYRRQADVAGQDMLRGLDSRAAASGMSGGSRHGTGIGMGFEGINSNLQDQMATTGYDAYNRDLDRKLNIGSENDQFNQQRALSDQQVKQNTQQQMSGLLGQQNDATSGAINQQEQMQAFMNGPMAGFMNSTAGMQFMQQMLGNANNLTQQNSTANGGVPLSSGSFDVGGIGGQWG